MIHFLSLSTFAFCGIDMSAYLIYQNTMRESFRSENPGMTFGQLSKYTSCMYHALTPEEKARWEQAAADDKARYVAEMADYVPPPGHTPNGVLIESYRRNGEAARMGGVGGRKIKKDPDAPKRARGPYVFFTLDERPRILLEFPDMKFTDLGHVMGQRWRALPAEEKKKYEELANVDKKRFQDEVTEYNSRKPAANEMDGHTHSSTHYSQHEQQQHTAAYAPHPQYQEAQHYAEQYYAQQQYPVTNAAIAAQYDPNAAAYAQYYAQQGFPPQPQQLDQTEFHY
jgi:hypothetical protein